MWHLIVARTGDSENEWLYLLLVVGMVVFTTIADRVKKLMAGDKGRPGASPTPSRPPVPPLRRPQIPQLPEARVPPPRSAPPPNAPFPGPPLRPVVRTDTASRPVVRPAPPAPKPMPGRAMEGRREIRSQPLAALRDERTVTPSVSRPRAPAAAPAAIVATGEKKAPDLGQMSRLQTLRQIEKPHVREAVAARSFRSLSVADMQRAMVLKEILEPPLAMRDA